MSIKASLGSIVSRCACCRSYIEYDLDQPHCDECAKQEVRCDCCLKYIDHDPNNPYCEECTSCDDQED